MEFNYYMFVEKYGREFADEVKDDIDFANEKGDKWSLEILDENSNLDVLGFITKNYVIFYEVSKKRKKVREKFIASTSELWEAIKVAEGLDSA